MKSLLISLLLCILLLPPAQAETAPLRLLAINVGKGDSLLLTCGEDAYLIDTGRAESYGAISAALRSEGITRLNGIIVTHTDSDHAGGAAALTCASLQVDAWYISPYFTCKPSKHPVMNALEPHERTAIALAPGDSLPLGDGTLRVLGPLRKDEELENNNSLVLLADTPEGTILLAGDMQFAEEEDLLAEGLLGPVDVLKVPDHAEKHSGSETFFSTVRAKVGVISTNSVDEPDTPSTRVLTALKRAGTRTVLTQSASRGVQITLRGGDPEVVLLMAQQPPVPPEGVFIDHVNAGSDTVTLHSGMAADVSISGWYLFSERGKQIFVFPENAVLPAGGSITVSALDSPEEGDFEWPDTGVWHKKKDDPCALYDAWGQLVDRLD